jgi:hypothetical protein
MKNGAPDRIRTCGLCLRRERFLDCFGLRWTIKPNKSANFKPRQSIKIYWSFPYVLRTAVFASDGKEEFGQ